MTREITPVFIVGAPRSGTTFLASSIGGHPDVITLPELQFLYPMMEEELVFGPMSTERKVEYLSNDVHFCSMNLVKTLQELESFVEGKGIKPLVLEIVSLFNAKHQQKDYSVWVEHWTLALRYSHIIRHYFPDSKFIHSLRDPRSVYSSALQKPWGSKDVIHGARAWNETVTDILSKEICLDIFTSRYETLVEFPEQSLREISIYIGLQFDERMLRNDGLIRNEKLEMQNPLAGQVADKTRREKWKKHISRKEAEHINAVCGKLMDKFLYLDENDRRSEITGLEMRFTSIRGLLILGYTSKKYWKARRKAFCNLE